MRRIEFLKKLSFTALLVAGIRNEVGAESASVVKDSSTSSFDVLPTYSMYDAEEVTSSLIVKIFKTGMDLDYFLELFATELQSLYPFEEISKVTSYHTLYFASIRCEVVCHLTMMLIRVWQNLCLSYGLEGYDKKELESDSVQIQNGILEFGKKFKVGDIDHFIKDSGETGEIQSTWTCLVSWFGSQKNESIISYPLILNVTEKWSEVEGSVGTPRYNESFVSEILAFTNMFLFQLDSIKARWHQYAVRYYYLNFAQTKFENHQREFQKSKKMIKTDAVFLNGSLSLESAIRTIKDRAFQMQSGVYHDLDRQNQQMVVSTLVQVIEQISSATRGEKDICKRLKLSDHYGGIITVSTAAMATYSLSVLEDALAILQIERKLHFP